VLSGLVRGICRDARTLAAGDTAAVEAVAAELAA
jgi:hypothetical protein